MGIDEHILHFIKEFGLILFIYSIGMQVGPSFFSSFKQGGITLNLLASSVVLLGVITTYVIHVVTGLPISTMVGILSGAVTNTPGLGAAQQTYYEVTGSQDPSIPMGYAAYLLGVVGILSLILSGRFSESTLPRRMKQSAIEMLQNDRSSMFRSRFSIRRFRKTIHEIKT